MARFDAADLLTDAQRNREPRWLIDGYATALNDVEAVELLSDDATPRPIGTHWQSADYFTRPGEAMVFPWLGGEMTPEEARRHAYQLLAHADIAEAQAGGHRC